jgi:hypothetical protein
VALLVVSVVAVVEVVVVVEAEVHPAISIITVTAAIKYFFIAVTPSSYE